MKKYQYQSFNFLGLNSIKIIDANYFRHVKADQIISVTHPYYFKKKWFYAQSNLPSWIIRFLRNDISKKVKSKKKVMIKFLLTEVTHYKTIASW